MFSRIPLSPLLYQRGAGGVPATSMLLPLMRSRINRIEWSITDKFGFESCTIQCTGTKEEALSFMNELGASLLITGPDADECWSGRLVAVAATLGQERHSRSLDGMYNRVRVRFTTPTNVSGVTPAVSDTTSQGFYGVRDLVESLPKCVWDAAVLRSKRVLDKTRWPVKTPASEVRTGELGQVDFSLTFEGWYGSLGYVMTSRSDKTKEQTTTQVGALIGTSSPGIGATNPFLNTSTSLITASGVSDTRFIAEDTTYRDKIEGLLSQGNSAEQAFSWGVYEDRTLRVDVWAGATPTTVTYRCSLGNRQVLNSAKSIVPFWRVRPNAMYEITDLLDVNPRSDEPDAAGRYYLARVTFWCDRNGMGVRLEPSDSGGRGGNLAAQLAQLTVRFGS